MTIKSMLLLGPTGAGKTPLGEYLQQVGLGGRRCVHFDFGANLRAVDSGDWRPSELTAEDVERVGASLRSGALLENENFHVAEAILRGVVAREGMQDGDLLLMNGMPRHIGQAADVDRIVSMQGVVSLDCSPETVVQRIAADSGGDRAVRTDDSVAEIRNKLRIFAERTMPLLDHYRALGVRIAAVPVGVRTQPADLVGAIEAALS